MKTDPRQACANAREKLVWALVHDFIAHPLMAVTLYSRPALRFHDFTSHRAWPRVAVDQVPVTMVHSRRYGVLMVRQVQPGVFATEHPTVAHTAVTNAGDAIEAAEKAEAWFDMLDREFGGCFRPGGALK